MEINLAEGEILILDSNFFVIKKGEVILRYIFEDGKSICFEFPLIPNDVSGNFFSLFSQTSPFYNDVTLEIQANKESHIKIFKFDLTKIDNELLNRLILQLSKQLIIKLWFQLYPKEAFVLLMLRIYSQKYNTIYKKYITYEVFNISKSQFYLIYSNLKKQKFIVEKSKFIELQQLSKIE